MTVRETDLPDKFRERNPCNFMKSNRVQSCMAAELKLHLRRKRGVVKFYYFYLKGVYCFYESVKTLILVHQDIPKFARECNRAKL